MQSVLLAQAPSCYMARVQQVRPPLGSRRKGSCCQARRYLFACGGTGGHIFPAIAVAKELQDIDPGSQILFMGDKARMEANVVPEQGFDWEAVPTTHIHRPLLHFGNFFAFFRIIYTVIRTWFKVRRFKPNVVLGTGGYVAFPTCAAAALCGIPFFLVEPNVLPGLVNRALCGWSRAVFTMFNVPSTQISKFKARRVGIPLRQDFATASRAEARKALGLSEDQLLLTVLGGSLGALEVSQLVRRVAAGLLEAYPKLTIKHQTGLYGSVDLDDEVRVAVQNIERKKQTRRLKRGQKLEPADKIETVPGHKRYKETPFIHDMACQLAASDLVVARAGAITCCELLAAGTPSILVPLKAAADSHQHFNAISMEAMGASKMLRQDFLVEEQGEDEDGLSAQAFEDTLRSLLDDANARAILSEQAKANARSDGRSIIAQAMKATAENPEELHPDVLRPFLPVMKRPEEEDDADEKAPASPPPLAT